MDHNFKQYRVKGRHMPGNNPVPFTIASRVILSEDQFTARAHEVTVVDQTEKTKDHQRGLPSLRPPGPPRIHRRRGDRLFLVPGRVPSCGPRSG